MYTVYQINKHIWLVVSTPLKNMKVSWDDDIPNIMESHNPVMFQTINHQPDIYSQMLHV